MYVSINGIGKNRGVYIQQSYRKPNEKTSSRIIRSLGRYNALLQRFDGDEKKMMEWAHAETDIDTKEYKEKTKNISVTPRSCLLQASAAVTNTAKPFSSHRSIPSIRSAALCPSCQENPTLSGKNFIKTPTSSTREIPASFITTVRITTSKLNRKAK